MASLHVSLSDEMRSFVDHQVQSGSYHNHSEYVRDLIRHDQERQAQKRVDSLLLEGLQSGEPVPLSKNDWQEIRDEVKDRLARKQAPQE